MPGAQINVEGGGSTSTDKDGSFSVRVKKTPYTLTVVDTLAAVAVRYEDLVTKEPELHLFGVQKKRKLSNIQTVTFQFPKIPEGKTIVVKFLCNDFHVSKEKLLRKGSTSVSITVEWPIAKESITGIVAFMENTKTGYELYSQYIVTLFKGLNSTEKIDLSKSNPGEIINNLTINSDPKNSSESGGGGVKLLSPDKEDVHYDSTLLFSYGMDFGSGIYIVSFISTFGNFHIVTNSINVTKPVENSYGMLRGNRCQWYVEKQGAYPNVDAFVKKDARKTGDVSRSETREFWLL